MAPGTLKGIGPESETCFLEVLSSIRTTKNTPRFPKGMACFINIQPMLMMLAKPVARETWGFLFPLIPLSETGMRMSCFQMLSSRDVSCGDRITTQLVKQSLGVLVQTEDAPTNWIVSSLDCFGARLVGERIMGQASCTMVQPRGLL